MASQQRMTDFTPTPTEGATIASPVGERVKEPGGQSSRVNPNEKKLKVYFENKGHQDRQYNEINKKNLLKAYQADVVQKQLRNSQSPPPISSQGEATGPTEPTDPTFRSP